MEYRYYVFGDSHSPSFGIPGDILGSPTGPITMYMIGNVNDPVYIDTYNLMIREGKCSWGKPWIISAGEIDCRSLIYKQVTEKGRDEDKVINSLVTNYISRLLSINPNTLVTTICPPVKEFNSDNPFPFRGSLEERARYVKKMNDKLIEVCANNNVTLINHYKYYADENGYMDLKYAPDNVHIRDNFGILQAYKDVGILT